MAFVCHCRVPALWYRNGVRWRYNPDSLELRERVLKQMKMNQVNATIGVVLTIFFLWGAASKQFFGGGVLGRNTKGRQVPRWLGRVWFLLMAAGSAYFTAKSL